MFNSKNIELIERITNEIWRMFDILRGSIPTDDLQVVLFLISAYKDRILRDARYSEYFGDINHDVLDSISNDSVYRKLLGIYAPIIKFIPSEKLEYLLDYVEKINLSDLEENFSEIFDNILYRLSDAQGKHSGEFIQPLEITRFIMYLANLPNNATVYNPFAGLASFGTFLNHSHRYYAQENNQRTWALGMLRLMAFNNINFDHYDLDDSIKNWFETEKFDLVVANPPFRLSIPRHLYSNYSGEPYVSLENFLIENGINSIKENGQLIAMFPLSFLFKGGHIGRLKKRLIENNIIDTIITLPSGLLSNTSIPVCIVVFKKIPKRKGFVRFVDASTFFIKEGPRNKTLNDKELNLLINNDIENNFLRYVSYSEIYKNEFDLSVKRYFLKTIEGSLLSTLTDIINGHNVPQNVKMKQVQIKNLKEEVFDGILTSNDLELKLIAKPLFKVIEESCILLCTMWNTLKPTYFKYTGEAIAIANGIVALKLKENVVDPTFLINELASDYVKEQLDSYRIGNIQKNIRIKDLQNIVIQLPSMQEQRAKVSGIIELSSRLKELESDKEDLLSGIKKEETESSTSLSHILGKPLLSIGSSLEIIMSSLTKEYPNWRDIMISESRQFKMSDAFESISKNVKYIQELTDENTALMSVSSFNLTEINFLKFLSEFVKSEKKSLKNNIELKLDIHEDIKAQLNNNVIVLGNEQKLKIVLINLIDNAKHHAFIDKNSEETINIEILPFTGNEKEASYLNYDINGRKSYVEIKVSNTGKPFPKDFTLEDYARKNFAVGKTRNRGLGGYEVNEIIKVHNEGKKALNIFSSEEGQKYSSTVSFLVPII